MPELLPHGTTHHTADLDADPTPPVPAPPPPSPPRELIERIEARYTPNIIRHVGNSLYTVLVDAFRASPEVWAEQVRGLGTSHGDKHWWSVHPGDGSWTHQTSRRVVRAHQILAHAFLVSEWYALKALALATDTPWPTEYDAYLGSDAPPTQLHLRV